MSPSLPLTGEIFTAFRKCPYKAYLKLQGCRGEPSDYEVSQARLAATYRAAARQALSRGQAPEVENSLPLPESMRIGLPLIPDATVSDSGESCRLDALERVSRKDVVPGIQYRPVLCIRREKLTAEDRLLLAFGGSILARVQGTAPATGKIVHGREFRGSRVELAALWQVVQETVEGIRVLREASKPPPLRLNRHCSECEFRTQCRAAAVEKDDLSLLGGLSPKEIAALNARGLFTVTQYSHTFRPGRLKRAAGKKHDLSLQALAVREKTVYVAQRPELPEGRASLFLDVEGLPDEGFYYLIGLTVVEGGSRRHLSFWVNTPAEEASAWAAFLAAVGAVEDFVLFHYGSYEAKFLGRMEARHGGEPGAVARLKQRSVNVLSLLHARVYFPVHANDLKSVAGCLGFRWSAPAASGLQAIAWRYAWEASPHPTFQQSLLTYNEEDCSALERVVGLLRSLGDGPPSLPGGTVPRVAQVQEAPGPYRHQFGATRFALPEFVHLARCAYFDYQRDKVLCRTAPRCRAARPRKERKRQAWKVNREVEWGRPTACPHCGSTGLDWISRQRKLVIDLKVTRGGIRRQVTRHKARRYRCRKCLGTFLPEGYLALPPGYGPALCGWVVYSSISLRQSNSTGAVIPVDLLEAGASD
jgi:predicted RecB family nuclease